MKKILATLLLFFALTGKAYATQSFNKGENDLERRRFYVALVDSSDCVTAATLEADGQPQISYQGGALGNTSNGLNHIANGLYFVNLTTTELSVLGNFVIYYKSANTCEFWGTGEVVEPQEDIWNKLRHFMLKLLSGHDWIIEKLQEEKIEQKKLQEITE